MRISVSMVSMVRRRSPRRPLQVFKLPRVQQPDEPSRTSQLLAERWAGRFCTIQRRMGFGEALMFTGAFLAATGWITFVILAKGTQDFQSSDLVIPAVLTAIAILLAGLGFSRQRRTRRDLKEATAALARELDKKPRSPSDAEQRSVWP
jgi:hypothetical protein